MSYIGDGEREIKQKQLKRHVVYNRSTDPIENLSRIEDAMTMVNAMKEESGLILKQGAVNRVVDPSYQQYDNQIGDNDMIFHPEDLNNQLANEFFSSDTIDSDYIKNLSYKEKKCLLKELEKIETKVTTNPMHINEKKSKNKMKTYSRYDVNHKSSRRRRSTSSSSSYDKKRPLSTESTTKRAKKRSTEKSLSTVIGSSHSKKHHHKRK